MADDDIRAVVPLDDPAQARMDKLREQARGWFAADVHDFRRSWVQNGAYVETAEEVADHGQH